ncbi:MAG: cupin domain-containing protein [Acidobacteriota bacterium]
MLIRNAVASAKFSPDKMGKTTLAQGSQMMVGLNAFEPGQEHAAHAHAGQDKLYVILEGQGTVLVGDETDLLAVGDVAFAPAGVTHSIHNPGPDRLLVMAVLAPPPSK